MTFKYFEKYTLNMRRVLIHGGNLHVRVLSPIAEVIREVNEVLTRLELETELLDDPRNRYVLATLIGHVLDGTTYALRLATVTLTLETGPGGLPALLAAVGFREDLRLPDGSVFPARALLGVPWMITADEVQSFLSGAP